MLYLAVALLPWFSVGGIEAGSGFSRPGFSITGFDLRLVAPAFVLLLIAAGWAEAGPVIRWEAPFPRSSLTAALAAPAFLLTVIEWLRTFDLGVSVAALLAVLVAAATLGAALLRLRPELRIRPDLPGRPAPEQPPDSKHPGPEEPGAPSGAGPPAGFRPPPQYAEPTADPTDDPTVDWTPDPPRPEVTGR